MAKQRLDAEKVELMTPEFRAHYPQLFTPRAAMKGANPKWSITMLFQTKETEASKAAGAKVVDIAPLWTLIRNVLIEKYGADKTKWPAQGEGVGQLQIPLHDGSIGPKKDRPGYGEGIWYASASSDPRWNTAPGIVYPRAGKDGRPEKLTIPTDVYAGMYARATINPYFWEYMGKIGVSLSLRHVQKLRDGEVLSAQGSAEDSFDAIEVPKGGAQPVGAGAAGGDIGL